MSGVERTSTTSPQVDNSTRHRPIIQFLDSRFMMMHLLFQCWLVALASCACIPPFPSKLLHDGLVLSHPSITSAFEKLQRNLSALANTTRDGLSLAIVRLLTLMKLSHWANGDAGPRILSLPALHVQLRHAEVQ